MLFASIDIGSNAVRLYFANAFTKNKLVVVEKASLIRIPVRLGEDVFKDGYISDTKRKSFLQTMTAFKMLIDVYKPLNYIACATSAMREALNNTEVIEEVKEKAGIEIKIIDGIQEAQILCALDCEIENNNNTYTMFIDVGGGSTEISIAHNHQRIVSESFRIGTIRMLMNKVEPDEWIKMKTFLKNNIRKYKYINCVGSGGNINKLAKIYGDYESRTLSFENLKNGYKEILKTPLKERIEKMGMRPDRADVIEPAGQIFLTIMEEINAKTIYVPKIGLIDGLIHLLYEDYKTNNKLSEILVK